jgi:hypothetical protein
VTWYTVKQPNYQNLDEDLATTYNVPPIENVEAVQVRCTV